MNSPIIQLREFHDGTWSIMARIWNPQKEFYEHPEYINLTKEEAQKICNELITNKPSLDDIISKWIYIGN